MNVRDSAANGDHRLVAVAVPVPLPQALTYSLPAGFVGLAEAGMRVRVRVGKRRLTGVIVGFPDAAPEGVKIRPVEDLVDEAPVLPENLLELARFTAEYYLAPLGEVLRAVLPAKLPGWGQRRLRLTDAGALAPPRNPAEAAVVEGLLELGTTTTSRLHAHLGPQLRDGSLAPIGPVLEALVAAGRVAMEDPGRRGGRFITAYELPPGDRAVQREACGRSKPAVEVVDFLDALGRPATGTEITETVGCGVGVLRRLVNLGVLRKFTQAERLSLDRHVLSPEEGRERFVLRPDQATAVEAITGVVTGGTYQPFLLQGMTGAGKTEVYLRAVEATLEQGRSAILLVPEIALVPALARAVRQRFGERLALLHSTLGGSERQQEWQRIREGDAPVVLGPRSAIFAPVTDLGLVVVDEEQDSAYKQDTTPRYHGRDLALVRGRDADAAVVLVSATPSLESRLNAERGRFQPLQLTQRAGGGSLPEGVLVDLKAEGAPRRPGQVVFSQRLRDEMEQALADGSQIILLRNRRGYSPVLLCRACGEDMRCDDCGLPRTYHRREGMLVCHYCGSRRAAPRQCPECDAEALEPIGTGTERLEEQFQELFPQVPAVVLDRDTVRRRGGAAAVLERFASGQAQVLLGTQMVAKGHHFPDVALTAVMAADSYLGFPDFRAVERTYNLLVQLAGRAGRGERPGKVVVQTYHPDHYAVRAALDHDDAGFAAEELRFRRIFHYPPYTRMVQLLLRDSQRERGEARMAELSRKIHAHPLARGVRIAGPAPAPLEKLRGKWRFQLLLRDPSSQKLRRLLEAVLPSKPDSDLVVDVDPQDLL
ncbi:MAG: primosomal protein N' [Acidobacteriota bacterium]|nr:primosomal protein N' [Acidobacteriota bacterium]